MFLAEEETSPKSSTGNTEKRVALTTTSQKSKPRELPSPHEEGHEATPRRHRGETRGDEAEQEHTACAKEAS